ncbi:MULTISPECIES: ATP-binding protein [Prevotellaceae]|jgi:predicted AAA+ superfamily ATPase|uniref:ATP-binding protein n=1 Tax=Prevotellaceae TaxID=171552 RepID=UPI0022E4AE9D|nr:MULTISPECIES: ATP-binding protein [Prevotellaceae]
MLFERKYYLSQLQNADGNGMIKIITGMRRCGKSFLLFNIFRKSLLERGIHEDHIIKVNLEDRRNKKLRNPDALLEHIDKLMTDTEKYYILLDEVQLVSEFEDVLNSYLDVPNAEVYVTGSNAKFLSRDIITEFRGRGWEVRIHPLSFAEYYEVIGGEKAEALDQYYKYGGLPAVAGMKRAKDKQNYLREIFETVYLRDVIDRNHLKNADGLRELVRILASTMGASTNVRRISNTFKTAAGIDVAPATIAKYIECLQDAFIISEALRYDVKGRKYIGTETKYYFEDLGIRNAVVEFRQFEPTHIMENVVYNDLCRNGFSVDVGLVESFKRDNNGKLTRRNLEIDFVVNRHDERLYIQSAYALPSKEKVDQEQASLLQVSDGFRKIIIAGDHYSTGYNENGILVIGLYDFLLEKANIWK